MTTTPSVEADAAVTPPPIPAARARGLAALAAAAVLAVVLAVNLGSGLLTQILLHLPGIDKAMHWVQYAGVFLVLWWSAGAFRLTGWTRIAVAVAGGLLVGVIDETVQRHVAGRTFQLEDLAVDAVALVGGAALVAPIRRVPTMAAILVASLGVTGLFAIDTHRRLSHYNRALLHERQHDLGRARLEYRLALAAGHASGELYNSLAWAEVESGEGTAAEAVRFAERALAVKPDDPDYLDTYGWALHHAGRSREALPFLERARDGKPDMYCIDYHLGVILRALDRDCEARRRFEQQVGDSRAPGKPPAPRGP